MVSLDAFATSFLRSSLYCVMLGCVEYFTHTNSLKAINNSKIRVVLNPKRLSSESYSSGFRDDPTVTIFLQQHLFVPIVRVPMQQHSRHSTKKRQWTPLLGTRVQQRRGCFWVRPRSAPSSCCVLWLVPLESKAARGRNSAHGILSEDDFPL